MLFRSVGLRRIFFREQFLGPRRIHFGQFQGCLGICKIALRLGHRRLKQNWIDLCDNVTRLHLGIKIGEEFLDIPRNLRMTASPIFDPLRDVRGRFTSGGTPQIKSGIVSGACTRLVGR